MPSKDLYNLERFLEAQADHYHQALTELRSGKKQSHWIWYIFPQVAGLGRSSTAQRYAIVSREEAVAYLNHEILGPRLIECSNALLPHRETSIESIMGRPDDMKLRSSMTLFDAVSESPDNPFREVLYWFYGSQKDRRTMQFLEKDENP
jgi:uncharacterized protein (DUF1810 family)